MPFLILVLLFDIVDIGLRRLIDRFKVSAQWAMTIGLFLGLVTIRAAMRFL